ncbi:MAG: ATP-binding protein [Thermodesulfovibrionia bacterium]|nr:ATP-binding protein [Thermodesulfovibrionia bacterium]
MSNKIINRTISILPGIRQEATLPKVTLFLSVVLLTGNLNAIVDSMLHPEISYFDIEHWIIGGVYALLVCILFMGMSIYYAQHKQEEDEIKRAKEEWERTFDAITQPVMILDANHKIVKANKTMADKLGVTPSEMQGLACYKVVHGLDEPHPTCPHSKLLADGQVHSAEIYEERLGGYFVITVSPIYDSEGRLSGSIHTGIDITERRKMEEYVNKLNEELERKIEDRTVEIAKAYESLKAENQARKEAEEVLSASEKRYRTLIETTGTGYVIIDYEGKVLNANQEYVHLTGHTDLNEIRGRSVMEWTADYEKDKNAKAVAKCARDGHIRNLEIHYVTGQGKVTPIEINATVMLIDGKAQILTLCRDITERKKAEEYLQNALITAEASNKVKSDFLANMSHELTTPLNSVIGFSQVLKDGLSGELNTDQQEYVDNVLQGGMRLLSLIRNMLDLVRAESGKDELIVKRFLLKETLKSSVAMFNEISIERNLKLTLQIEPAADIVIETDAGKLTRILYNLIDNAVKFTPAGGSVSVSARKIEAEKLIEISVTDTGIGITPENIDKLFQPFAQLESPYTKTYGGTGIGLILTKRFVELLGGRIWAESEYGKGSKFIFVIPI